MAVLEHTKYLTGVHFLQLHCIPLCHAESLSSSYCWFKDSREGMAATRFYQYMDWFKQIRYNICLS